MFHNTWIWIKGHPLYVALGVGGLVLLYILVSRGSSAAAASSSGSAVSSGPSDAQVASGNALQLGMAQVQAGVYGVNAQLEGQRDQLGAQVAIAQITANSADHQTDVQGQVQDAGIAAQTLIAMRSAQSQDYLSQQQTAQIQSGQAAQVDMAKITADTYEALASYQAQTTIASFQTQKDIQLGSYDRDVSIANINAGVTNKQTQAKSTSSTLGVIGSVVGGLLSFL